MRIFINLKNQHIRSLLLRRFKQVSRLNRIELKCSKYSTWGATLSLSFSLSLHIFLDHRNAFVCVMCYRCVMCVVCVMCVMCYVLCVSCVSCVCNRVCKLLVLFVSSLTIRICRIEIGN
jgi:hypothetical protein